MKCNTVSMMDQWQSFGEKRPRFGVFWAYNSAHYLQRDQLGEIWVTVYKGRPDG